MAERVFEYFPGANTPMGFFSYYDQILHSREAKKIIVLKGGPGTGKSTFMKRVSDRLIEKGYDIELLHCSSDPKSLDGVCAREIGFLILDGTSPHIVDPRVPGAVDEIINLGDCWDSEAIKLCKEKIIYTNEKISACFKRAYKYLKAAKSIGEQIECEMNALTDYDLVTEEKEKLKKMLDINSFGKKGSERKAFLSAMTPLGKTNYTDSFLKNAKHVYEINAKNATASKIVMAEVKDALLCGGEDIKAFYCPMSPDEKIEHIYIPSKDILITTSNRHHTIAKTGDSLINLDLYVDMVNLSADGIIDMDYYDTFIKRACTSISHAKRLHDELEQNYIPYMDFDKIEKLCNKVIENIE